MNLHGIVASAVAGVNPMVPGTVLVSIGNVKASGGRLIPSYAPPQKAMMQVQALTNKDILHLQGINQSESTHTVYIQGRLEWLVRPDNKGGDILKFNWAMYGSTPKLRTWLVTAVLEDWPDWTKVSVTLQNDP